jgi:hypothetical protein
MASRLLALLVVLASAACGGAQNAAAHDPMKCERDPDCRAHQKAFDCSAQCADDPACVDRCNQIQQQTGTSSPR